MLIFSYIQPETDKFLFKIFFYYIMPKNAKKMLTKYKENIYILK